MPTAHRNTTSIFRPSYAPVHPSAKPASTFSRSTSAFVDDTDTPPPDTSQNEPYAGRAFASTNDTPSSPGVMRRVTTAIPFLYSPTDTIGAGSSGTAAADTSAAATATAANAANASFILIIRSPLIRDLTGSYKPLIQTF